MWFPFPSTDSQEYQKQLPKPNPSRTRDHLANERTYLAWMRSAISLIGFGVLIVRLRLLRPPLAPQQFGNGWKLGLIFSIVGLVMVLFSTQHYFTVRNDIDRDTYAPPDRWIILTSMVILLLGLGVIYYVFNIQLETQNLVIFE